MSRGATDRSAAWLLGDGGTVWDGPAAPGWPSFDQACAAHPRGRVTLWVSGHLLHHVVAPRDLPLHDDAAMVAYARQLFVHHHGAAAADWSVGAWSSGGTRGASVLHGIALSSLQAAAQRHGVALTAVRPWWSAVLARLQQQHPQWHRAPQARLAIVEHHLVTWVQLERGCCADVQHGWLAEATGATLLDALADASDARGPTIVCGHGLRGALPQRDGVTWLEGLAAEGPTKEWLPAPPSRRVVAPQPEWLPRVDRAPALAATLAVASALALLATAWPAWQTVAEIDKVEAEVAALRALAERTQVTHAPTGQAKEASPHLAAWAAALQHPWGEVLAGVEAAAAQDLRWLTLEHRAARRDLRLEGLAAQPAAALRSVEALAATGLWTDVHLLRLQAEAGASAQRFEVSARSDGVAP